jgi:hypothetical protein
MEPELYEDGGRTQVGFCVIMRDASNGLTATSAV